MKTFVIIFRQGPQQLTEADKQRRAQETTAWAKAQNAAGHKLDPRILAPESERRGSADSASGERPVTALLFLEARDLNEATQVAEAHPALRYGSEVEVRPWGPPVPVGAPLRQQPRGNVEVFRADGTYGTHVTNGTPALRCTGTFTFQLLPFTLHHQPLAGLV
jgi:hypothetical protein